LTVIAGLAFALSALSAEKEYFGRVRFDKTVHDFGTIGSRDGAQECRFTLTNIGTEPLLVEAVISSCGCTSVEWTRSLIAPGAQGSISATYSNEDGPYPFDKTLTVYISDEKKPVILHLRGEVVK